MTNETQKQNRLIAVYGRVSTSNQENEGTIETQLSAVNEFAKKNGHTIVQQYTDNGWSGDSLARPALDQLRGDAKKKIWEAVLIYDPDRLARRYSYQELVLDELKEAGIEVIFVTVSTPKNSEDKILYGVRGLFAEYERAKISERFRLGKLRKVKEGHILLSEAPYGYRYIPKKDKEHGYFEIDENEARVLKMIYKFVADDGLTLRKVVKKLQDLGLRPRKCKRGVWATSTLSKTLRNRTYIGEAHWGTSVSVVPINPYKIEKYKKLKKTSRRKTPEENWLTISVPPIIDKDLFNRTGIQLEMNFRLCQRNKKNEYLLSGRIYCDCGCRRAGEGPQRGKHLYYRCNDRVKTFPLPSKCAEKGINARIADKLVWRKIAALMSSPSLIRKYGDRWANAQKSRIPDSVGDVQIIAKEIAKIKGESDRYTKAYGAGVITIESLQSNLTPLKERISDLELQRVKTLENQDGLNSSLLPDQKEIDRFAGQATKGLCDLNFERKRGIVLNVIEKIIGTREKLQVNGYLPITEYVGYKNIDWNCGPSKRRQIDAF